MFSLKGPLGSWSVLGFAALAILAVYFELFSGVEVIAAFPESRVQHFILFLVLAGAAGFASHIRPCR